MRITYFISKMIEKIKIMLLLIKLSHYRTILHFECKNCGSNPRLYSPISIKGLKHFNIGNDFKLDYHGIIEAWDQHNGIIYKPTVSIGNNVSIGKRFHLGCINKIIIEDDVLIGSDVLMIDHNHGKADYSDALIAPNRRSLSSKGGIHICKNVWIGEKVCVLPGVTIGENSIVGANAVVTRDIPNNCIVCGNPAKIVKRIKID